MNSERKMKNYRPSWAVRISLLLHGFVLVGMGVGTLPGATPEPGELVVFLAMPSAVAEWVPVTITISGEETIPEIPEAQSIPQVQQKPQEIMPQTTAEIMVPEEKPVPELVPPPEFQISDQPEIVQDAVEPVVHVKPSESVFEDLTAFENDGIEFVTRNPKPFDGIQGRPETRNSANAMLAFAGNPTALGMLARDVLGPELVEAEALSLPEPVYPILSRKRGEEGRVVLEVTISAEGGVRGAEIFQSSSFRRLDRAALEAVKIAAFNPATEFGIPVESELKIAYRFELEN